MIPSSARIFSSYRDQRRRASGCDLSHSSASNSQRSSGRSSESPTRKSRRRRSEGTAKEIERGWSQLEQAAGRNYVSKCRRKASTSSKPHYKRSSRSIRYCFTQGSDDANTSIDTTTDVSVGNEDLLSGTSDDEMADELFFANFDGNLLDRRQSHNHIALRGTRRSFHPRPRFAGMPVRDVIWDFGRILASAQTLVFAKSG